MLNNHTVAAIIVAAGNSRRMGFDKLLYKIDGETVLEKSLHAFDVHPAVDELVVVAGLNSDQVRPLLAHVKKPCRLVQGGETRADSVRNGVAATGAQYVAIHDAARPFVSQAVISDALSAAYVVGAAAPAVPVKDTVKVVNDDGTVRGTPARDTLYAVQTPQCFYAPLYRQVVAAVETQEVTDDCSLFELAGLTVKMTKGDYKNVKITTPEDLPQAGEDAPREHAQNVGTVQPPVQKVSNTQPEQAPAPAQVRAPQTAPQAAQAHKEPAKQPAPAQTPQVPSLRIGHGYDVHRLVENRPLILGGVTIPYEKGLLGHSDADVLTHAVMDAILGAAALGDIGHLFPDNDPAYDGADSIVLLREVGKVLKECGYTVQNLDATVLAQAPKLAPHIVAMRTNIARALNLPVQAVSVKATTEEGLGFTGTKQGIAAHSVCLLQKA